MIANTYTHHYFHNEMPEPTVDVHKVPVEFQGHRIPGVYALIGAYGKGYAYIILMRGNEYLNERASFILRARGLLPPHEYVGAPDCSRDVCILTERYSTPTGERWRRAIDQLPAAAAAFQQQRQQRNHERKGLAAWSTQKELPSELQYLIEEFVGATPSWSTWLRSVAL
jgi:hypothetical protein